MKVELIQGMTEEFKAIIQAGFQAKIDLKTVVKTEKKFTAFATEFPDYAEHLAPAIEAIKSDVKAINEFINTNKEETAGFTKVLKGLKIDVDAIKKEVLEAMNAPADDASENATSNTPESDPQDASTPDASAVQASTPDAGEGQQETGRGRGKK